MKKLLFLYCSLFLIHCSLSAQSTYRLLGDTVKMFSYGANGSTFLLENSTRYRTGAFLRNVANGRTDFAYAIDSSRISNDTMFFHRGDGWYALKLPASGGGGGGGVSDITATNAPGQTWTITGSTTKNIALSLTKSAVGLSNLDNTADVDKPVSTAQQTALDAKVTGNSAITGATKTKITYDAKGLVTSGADATTADIAASANKNYVTDAQQTVIGNTSGTNSGDETATTIKTKLGITTLSGSNTGDQDLSTYETIAHVNADTAAIGLAARNNINTTNGNVATNTTAIAGKENTLGNPASNGYVLSSTTSGTRSWVAQSGGSGTALANLYTKDSSLSDNRTVTMGAYTMSFRGNKTNFDSTATGTDYNRVGVLVNENFSSGAIPSGWTKGSGLTISYAGGKATITGASSLGAPSGSAITAAYTSGLQYDTRRMPYGKIDFEIPIVANTKSANAVVGLATGTLGTTVYLQKGIFFDLSNGPNSGRVALATGAPVAIPTFTTNGDSTSKANFSTGDSLVLYVRQNEWSIVAGIKNKTTGQTTATYFYQQWAGSGGRWNVTFLNGTYVLTNFKATVNDRKGGVYFITDSQGAGNGNSQQSKRFPDLIFNGNPKYFSLWGLPSLSAKGFVDGGLAAELIADAAPSKVVYALGYNDITETFTAPNTKTQVDSAIYPMQRAGVQVGIMGTVPRSITTDLTNDSLQSLAATRGADFYDIRGALKYSAGNLNGQYKYIDNIHINDSGAYKIEQVVIAKSGDSLLAEMAADTLFTAKLLGVQSTNATLANQLLTITPAGRVHSIPNNLPTPGAWLQNGNSIGGASQTGSMRLSGVVRSDASLQSVSGQGIQIGGNDSTNTNTSNANLQITNFGVGGTGFPQAFVSITGAGNIWASMSSANKTKSGQTGSITGSNNTMLNTNVASAISGSDIVAIGSYNWAGTTGSGSIGIGANALKGITTANNVISLATRNTSANSLTNVGDYIQIGDVSSAATIAAVAGDFIVDPYIFNAAFHMYLGGKAALGAKTISIGAPRSSGSNVPGVGLLIDGGYGTGIGETGPLVYLATAPTTTGSTLQSTVYSPFKAERTGITVSSATVTPVKAFDALADFQSTVGSFIPPRMTTTQRDLLSTGLLTATTSAVGSGYTNGNTLPLVFSGGGCSTSPIGYVNVAGNVVVGNPVITNRGSGCTSAPSATLTSGAGTGATFAFSIGVTEGATIYNLTTHQIETWNATAFAH